MYPCCLDPDRERYADHVLSLSLPPAPPSFRCVSLVVGLHLHRRRCGRCRRLDYISKLTSLQPRTLNIERTDVDPHPDPCIPSLPRAPVLIAVYTYAYADTDTDTDALTSRVTFCVRCISAIATSTSISASPCTSLSTQLSAQTTPFVVVTAPFAYDVLNPRLALLDGLSSPRLWLWM